jgi:hypothetical protein
MYVFGSGALSSARGPVGPSDETWIWTGQREEVMQIVRDTTFEGGEEHNKVYFRF